MAQNNIVWHKSKVSQKDREKLLSQKGMTLLLTGLSGSGKSTIATAVESYLYDKGYLTYLLDGDNLRHGLNGDLNFSETDRKENIRRVAEVSKLFVDAGIITLVSAIAPYEIDRSHFRERVGSRFYEVYVHSTVELCMKRDPKGLYQKVKQKEISNFTGIDAPYEQPRKPDLTLDTVNQSVNESTIKLAEFIIDNLEVHNLE